MIIKCNKPDDSTKLRAGMIVADPFTHNCYYTLIEPTYGQLPFYISWWYQTWELWIVTVHTPYRTEYRDKQWIPPLSDGCFKQIE